MPASPDPRAALLDELEGQLEILITGLEGDLSAEAFMRLWEGCEATFARFRSAQEARAGEEIPHAIRAKMEGVMRLQAVVSTMGARLREDLTAEADKVAGARARIESLDARTHLGQSRDISG